MLTPINALKCDPQEVRTNKNTIKPDVVNEVIESDLRKINVTICKRARAK